MIETISKLVLGALALFVLYKFIRSLRLVPTQKAFIVERLGRYHKTLEAGFHALIPFVDWVAYKQDLREEAIEVEPQECFTYDNVKVEVDGVIYLKVVDPVNASYGITNYRFAAIQLAQTTTRSVIGKMELDRTFEERAAISSKVVDELEAMEKPWGIQVLRYEIKNIETPRTVQKAMEKQMSAERERRATIARAQGVKESRVNDAEGKKTEMINVSEGEKQKRINEAEGVAQEINSIAEATAKSLEQIAGAVSSSEGKEAMKLRLAERYLTTISKMGSEENQIILPANLSNFEEVMKNLSLEDLAMNADSGDNLQQQ